ncbi:hypothetical protein BDQ17DRAFT_1345854 [Cyathus striatus]|nr:hypothetical protein BDQ17DRAFT_1345854 [Cyathus striatus]
MRREYSLEKWPLYLPTTTDSQIPSHLFVMQLVVLFNLAFVVATATAFVSQVYVNSVYDIATVPINQTSCQNTATLQKYSVWGDIPSFSSNHSIMGIPMNNTEQDCGRCVLVSYNRASGVTGNSFATVVEGLNEISVGLARVLTGDTIVPEWMSVDLETARPEECGLVTGAGVDRSDPSFENANVSH